MSFAAVERQKGQRTPRHEEEDVGDPRRGGSEEGIVRQRTTIVTMDERNDLGDGEPLPKVGAARQHRDQSGHRNRKKDQQRDRDPARHEDRSNGPLAHGSD